MKLRTILNAALEKRLKEDAERSLDLFSEGQHAQSLFDALGTAWKDAEFYLELVQREETLGRETLGDIGTFLGTFEHTKTTYDSACEMIREYPTHLATSRRMVEDDWKRYNAFYDSLKAAYEERISRENEH